MAFLDGIEDLRGPELLIKLFHFVQNIPYRISPFDDKFNHAGESVSIFIKKGDCRHKSLLLYNLLQEKNFDVDKVKVIFDWKDLAIPKEILGILKKSGTRWSSDALKLNINEHYPVYVDPTWNFELERAGFPVTKVWDGKGMTKQITEGELEYFDAEGFRDADHGIVLDKDEVEEFSEALNAWLDSVAPIR
jgi:hypothetical protein